jgi:hypothetical protein
MKPGHNPQSVSSQSGQQALPEPSAGTLALPDNDNNVSLSDNDTEMALDIANNARKQWNDARTAEIEANNRLQDEKVQRAMAHDIFMAVIGHLHTLPSGVRDKVIAKFQALPSPKRLITL